MMRFKRPLMYGGLFSILTLFLSACSNRSIHRQPPTGFIYGPIYHYLGEPMSHLITWMANTVGNAQTNGYGWAILVITLIVRLILMPLMLSQSKNATRQQHKMAAIKPAMDDIQKRQKAATSQEEKAAISQEMMALYKDNNVSMTGGIGCLPLIIQLPIFSALYMAIQYNQAIFHSTFFGINLGQTNIIVALIAGLTYVGQSYLSLVGVPESQRQQMKTMMLMSPVMTFFISLVSPAGLGLYFLAGGILAIIQTAITNFYYVPKIKAEIAADLKEHPIKVVTPKPAAPVAPKKAEPKAKIVQSTPKKNHQPRNAGKQHR